LLRFFAAVLLFWFVSYLVVLSGSPGPSGFQTESAIKTIRGGETKFFVETEWGLLLFRRRKLSGWVTKLGAEVGTPSGKSGRGLPHGSTELAEVSKTLRDRQGKWGMSARSWTAPVPWRF